MKTIINFILKSSADPKKTSLTVKMALLGIVPLTMQTLGLVCAIGVVCTEVDQNFIERFIDAIADIVYLSTALVASLGTAYGLARKIHRTSIGQNRAMD